MDLALFILVLQIGFNSALNYRHSNRMAVIPSSRLFNIELSRRSAPYNRNLQRTSRSYSGSDSEETDFDYTSYEEPISFTSFKLYKRRKNPTQFTEAHNEARFEQSPSKLHSDNHVGPLDKEDTDYRRPYILHGTQNRRLGLTSIHDIKDLEDVVHRRAANYLKLLFTIIEEQNSRRNLNDDRKVPINSPATSSTNSLGSRFVETANRRRSNHEDGERYKTDSRNNQPLPLRRAGSFDALPMPISRSQLRIPDPLKPSKHETARRRDDDDDVDYNNDEENYGYEDEDGNNDENDYYNHDAGNDENNDVKEYDHHHVGDDHYNVDKKYDHHHVEYDHNNDENEYDHHHVEEDHNNEENEYDHHHVEDDHNNDDTEYHHHHVGDEYNNAHKEYEHHHVEDDYNNDEKGYDHHHVEDDHNNDDKEYDHHLVEDDHNNDENEYDHHQVEYDHNNDENEYNHHHVEDDHNNEEKEYDHHHVEDEYNNAHKEYEHHHVEDDYNNDDTEYHHHHVGDEYNNAHKEYEHHHVEDDYNNDEKGYDHHHVEDDHNTDEKDDDNHHVEDDQNNDENDDVNHDAQDDDTNDEKDGDYYNVEDDDNNDEKDDDNHDAQDGGNHVAGDDDNHYAQDDDNNDEVKDDNDDEIKDHNDEEYDDEHDAEDNDNLDTEGDDYDFEFENDDSCELSPEDELTPDDDVIKHYFKAYIKPLIDLALATYDDAKNKAIASPTAKALLDKLKVLPNIDQEDKNDTKEVKSLRLSDLVDIKSRSISHNGKLGKSKEDKKNTGGLLVSPIHRSSNLTEKLGDLKVIPINLTIEIKFNNEVREEQHESHKKRLDPQTILTNFEQTLLKNHTSETLGQQKPHNELRSGECPDHPRTKHNNTDDESSATDSSSNNTENDSDSDKSLEDENDRYQENSIDIHVNKDHDNKTDIFNEPEPLKTTEDANETNSILNLEFPWNNILSPSDDSNNTSSEVDMEDFLRNHDSRYKPEYSDLMTLSPSDDNSNTSSEVDMELTPDDDVIRHYFEALIKPLIDLVLATYDDANNKDIASPTVKALLDKLKVLTNIDEEDEDDNNEVKSLRLSDLVDIKSPLISHGGKQSKSKEDKKNTVRLSISPIHRSFDLTETLGDLKVMPINLRVEIPFNNKVREEQHESHNKRLDSQTLLTSMLTNFDVNERNSNLNLEVPWNVILSPSDGNNSTSSEVDMEDFLRNHDSRYKPEYSDLMTLSPSDNNNNTSLEVDMEEFLRGHDSKHKPEYSDLMTLSPSDDNDNTSSEVDMELSPDDDVIRHYFEALIKPLKETTYDDAINKDIASPTVKVLLDKLKVLTNIDEEDKDDTNEVKSLRLSDLVDIKSPLISHDGKLSKSKEDKKNTIRLLISPIHRSSDLTETLGDLKVIPINLRVEIPFNNKVREEQHESHNKRLDSQTLLTSMLTNFDVNERNSILNLEAPWNEILSPSDGNNNTSSEVDMQDFLRNHDSRYKPEYSDLMTLSSSDNNNNTSSEVDMEEFLRGHDSKHKPQDLNLEYPWASVFTDETDIRKDEDQTLDLEYLWKNVISTEDNKRSKQITDSLQLGVPHLEDTVYNQLRSHKKHTGKVDTNKLKQQSAKSKASPDEGLSTEKISSHSSDPLYEHPLLRQHKQNDQKFHDTRDNYLRQFGTKLNLRHYSNNNEYNLAQNYLRDVPNEPDISDEDGEGRAFIMVPLDRRPLTRLRTQQDLPYILNLLGPQLRRSTYNDTIIFPSD